jgi:hypothetical protein
MTNLTIKNLIPPEKYTISDLDNGDFFFYPEDDNCLYVKCTLFNDARNYFALCMDTHSVMFGKVNNFEYNEEVIPIDKVELSLEVL